MRVRPAVLPRLAAALLLSACAAAPPVPPEESGEWDRELPEGVRIGWTHHLVRVVDDATGEPVAGARIDNWWEADAPNAEPWEDLREPTVAADRDGLALLPYQGRGPWYYVSAPGRAVLGEYGLPDEFRLVPGTDFPVEVRDWLGRPVPGAAVEVYLGCGHTPPVQEAVADARGRLLLRGVDPATDSLWIRAAGVSGQSAAYGGGFEDLPVEEGFHVLHGDPSPVVEGVVLRDDGTPAPGVEVGTRSLHRGPWTTAGPDGRFRLVGIAPHDDLQVVVPPPGGPGSGPWKEASFPAAPGVRLTLRLPPFEAMEDLTRGRKGEAPRVAPPAGTVPLRVRVWAGGDLLPFGRTRVVAVREEAGLVLEERPEFRLPEEGAGVEAVAEFRVAPGTWTVTAGTPAGMLAPLTERVEVGESGAETSLGLAPNPTWRPVVLDRDEAGAPVLHAGLREGRFWILTADGREEAVPAAAMDGSLHVPEEGPFVVEFWARDGRRARAVFREAPGEGGPVLVLPPARPEEPWDQDTPRRAAFPPARLAVRLPDGSPAAGAEVGLLGSPGAPPRIDTGLTLDGEGSAEYAFARGDLLTVTVPGREDLAPLRARIEGAGPWTLRWPAAEVAVRAVDEAGAAVPEFEVLLAGGASVDAAEGMARVRGLPAGPVRLWVEASGRRGRDLRLVLREGERREASVVLRPTPEEE